MLGISKSVVELLGEIESNVVHRLAQSRTVKVCQCKSYQSTECGFQSPLNVHEGFANCRYISPVYPWPAQHGLVTAAAERNTKVGEKLIAPVLPCALSGR